MGTWLLVEMLSCAILLSRQLQTLSAWEAAQVRVRNLEKEKDSSLLQTRTSYASFAKSTHDVTVTVSFAVGSTRANLEVTISQSSLHVERERRKTIKVTEAASISVSRLHSLLQLSSCTHKGSCSPCRIAQPGLRPCATRQFFA